LETCFLNPVKQSIAGSDAGKALDGDIPVSAIFFGPPGTSKTNLCKHVSEYLGWPLLEVNPSYFVQEKMENVWLQARKIFEMLTECDQLVVLFDEFDEMVRARGTAPEMATRFLTTMMLPYIIKLNKSRRLIFIVATNHIEAFDVAISRPGRFDLILQVMPPACAVKLEQSPELKSLLDGLGVLKMEMPGMPMKVDRAIGILTFDEFKKLRKRIESRDAGAEVHDILEDIKVAVTSSTLMQTADVDADDAAHEKMKKPTWLEVCEKQQVKNRLPDDMVPKIQRLGP